MTKWLILTVLTVPAVALAQTSRPTSRPSTTPGTKPVALVAAEQLKLGAVLTLPVAHLNLKVLQTIGTSEVLLDIALPPRVPTGLPETGNAAAWGTKMHLVGCNVKDFATPRDMMKSKATLKLKVVGLERLPADAPPDRSAEYLRLEVVKP